MTNFATFTSWWTGKNRKGEHTQKLFTLKFLLLLNSQVETLFPHKNASDQLFCLCFFLFFLKTLFTIFCQHKSEHFGKPILFSGTNSNGSERIIPLEGGELPQRTITTLYPSRLLLHFQKCEWSTIFSVQQNVWFWFFCKVLPFAFDENPDQNTDFLTFFPDRDMLGNRKKLEKWITCFKKRKKEGEDEWAHWFNMSYALHWGIDILANKEEFPNFVIHEGASTH